MTGPMKTCFVLVSMMIVGACGTGEDTDVSPPAVGSDLPSIPGTIPLDPDGLPTVPGAPPLDPDAVPAVPDDMPAIPDDMPAVTATAIDICADNGGRFFTEDLELIDHTVGADYLVTCNAQFRSGTLTIQRGVEVVFESAVGLYIDGESEIRALGGYDGALRAEPSIRFRGDSVSGAPSWNGVQVSSSSVDNLLENVEIVGAGFQPINGIFFPAGGSALLLNNNLTIRGLSIDDSGGHGIYMGDSAAFGQLQDVVIGETIQHPLLMPTHVAATQLAENAGNVLFTSLDDDNFSSIGLYGNQLNNARLGGRTSYVFEDHDIPYHARDGFFGNGGLGIVINAGTDFIMGGGTSITSGGGTGGRLTIAGSAEEPVTFRGAEALAGFWSGITYVSNSDLNRVDNAIVSDAVNGLRVNGRASNNISVSVSNSRFGNTSECGIRVVVPFSSLDFETTGNVYADNGEGDMNDTRCLGNFKE